MPSWWRWQLPEILVSLRPPDTAYQVACVRHINNVGAISKHHVAAEYLKNMRSRMGPNLHTVIDRDGNFGDARLRAEAAVDPSDPSGRLWTVLGGNRRGLGARSESRSGFMPWWEEEFLRQEYQLTTLRNWVWYAFLTLISNTVMFMFSKNGSQPEDCRGDASLTRARQTAYPVFSRFLLTGPWLLLPSLTLLVILHFARTVRTHQLSRVYPRLVFWLITSIAVFCFSLCLIRDLSLAAGGEHMPAESCSKVAHVSLSINYSTWIPTRTCVDLDPRKSLTEWPYGFSLGCENLFIDATYPRIIEFQLVLVFLRASWRLALKCALMQLLFLVVGSLAVGFHGWRLVFLAAVHCCLSLVTSYLCWMGTHEARDQFAKVKHFKLAAKLSRKSLYTLIPPNVLARLASHSHDMGILATDIEHCTVMFCSVIFRSSLGASGGGADNSSWDDAMAADGDLADFERLHAVYLEFDEAVNGSRLYKYQHVGDWYILACPNAAEPFALGGDKRDSVGSLPGFDRRASLAATGEGGSGNLSCGRKGRGQAAASYASDAAVMAQQLREVAQRHGFDLRVGIHTGSAAGAVIGKMRAFYCIYGETVNAASRLCKSAPPGRIHCSQGFVSCLNTERKHGDSRAFQCESCGLTPLKGLAPIETFVLYHAPHGEEQDGEGENKGPRDRAWLKAKSFEASFNVDAFSKELVMEKIRKSQRRNSKAAEDPLMSILQAHDLSDESRTLIDDELGAKQNAFIYGFDDPSLEDDYTEQVKLRRYRRMGAGTASHMVGVVLLYMNLLYPEDPYDFEALGPALTAAHTHMAVVLDYYLAVQGVLSVVVALGAYRGRASWTEYLTVLLSIMRVSFVLVAIYISFQWPARQRTLIFPTYYSMSQFLVVTLNFRHALVLMGAMSALYGWCFWRVADIINGGFWFRFFCYLGVICMFLVWNEDAQRRRWRLHEVFHREIQRFDAILDDLLPINLHKPPHDVSCAPRAKKGGGAEEGRHPREVRSPSLDSLTAPCQQRYALVLQLDLCGFTELSTKITPMELAQVMHHLFSAFDSTVESLNLFKVSLSLSLSLALSLSLSLSRALSPTLLG